MTDLPEYDAETEVARVVPYTETLAVHVERQPPEDEDELFTVPTALLDAFEVAHCAAYNAGEVLVGFVEGATAARQDVPGLDGPVFGDPRRCWNPVPHVEHSMHWTVGDVHGASVCAGDGKVAARMLGLLTERSTAKIDPAAVDPHTLIDVLRQVGFIDRGGRSGVYVRLQWPETRDGRQASVIVPLDAGYADYLPGIEAVLGELELLARIGRVGQAALDRLRK